MIYKPKIGGQNQLQTLVKLRRFGPSLFLDLEYRSNLLNELVDFNFNHLAQLLELEVNIMDSTTASSSQYSFVGSNSGNESPLHSGVRPATMDSPG